MKAGTGQKIGDDLRSQTPKGSGLGGRWYMGGGGGGHKRCSAWALGVHLDPNREAPIAVFPEPPGLKAHSPGRIKQPGQKSSKAVQRQRETGDEVFKPHPRGGLFIWQPLNRESRQQSYYQVKV